MSSRSNTSLINESRLECGTMIFEIRTVFSPWKCTSKYITSLSYSLLGITLLTFRNWILGQASLNRSIGSWSSLSHINRSQLRPSQSLTIASSGDWNWKTLAGGTSFGWYLQDWFFVPVIRSALVMRFSSSSEGTMMITAVGYLYSAVSNSRNRFLTLWSRTWDLWFLGPNPDIAVNLREKLPKWRF